MKYKTVLKSLLSLLIILGSNFCLAQDVFKYIADKEQKKRSDRWSIVDYLVTKKKIALMDQWLALNSSSASWVELRLDYLQGNLEREISNASTVAETDYKKMGGALFLKFLGVEGGREVLSEISEFDYYQLNLLLLGPSIQSSHIMLHGGQRDFTYDETTNFKQAYYGASIDLYLLSFLGVGALYRKYNEEISEDNLFESSGHRLEYSAFIDLFLLRLKGVIYEEKNDLISKSSGEEAIDSKDSGVYFGASLYF